MNAWDLEFDDPSDSIDLELFHLGPPAFEHTADEAEINCRPYADHWARGFDSSFLAEVAEHLLQARLHAYLKRGRVVLSKEHGPAHELLRLVLMRDHQAVITAEVTSTGGCGIRIESLSQGFWVSRAESTAYGRAGLLVRVMRSLADMEQTGQSPRIPELLSSLSFVPPPDAPVACPPDLGATMCLAA